MRLKNPLLVGLLCLLLAGRAAADLPIHCIKAQVEGVWTFSFGKERTIENPEQAKCGYLSPTSPMDAMTNIPPGDFETVSTMTLVLDKFNTVYDEDYGEKTVGTWTMMYDEGMIIEHKVFSMFVFFRYSLWDGKSKTDCSKTLIGWYKNKTNGKMGCFYGDQVRKANLISSISKGEAIIGIETVPEKEYTTFLHKPESLAQIQAEPIDSLTSEAELMKIKNHVEAQEDSTKSYAAFARALSQQEMSTESDALEVDPKSVKEDKKKQAKDEKIKSHPFPQSKADEKAKKVQPKQKVDKKTGTTKIKGQPAMKKEFDKSRQQKAKKIKAENKKLAKKKKQEAKTKKALKAMNEKKPKLSYAVATNASSAGSQVKKDSKTANHATPDKKKSKLSRPHLKRRPIIPIKKRKKLTITQQIEKEGREKRARVKIRMIKPVKINKDEIKVSKKPKSLTVDKDFHVKDYNVRVFVHWMRRPKTDEQVRKELELAQTSFEVVESVDQPFNAKPLVDYINSQSLGWKAYEYPSFAGKSLDEINRLTGRLNMFPDKKSLLQDKESENMSSSATFFAQRVIYSLPKTFTLEKYLSKVRTQKTCGNCYLVATVAMLEARIRMKYNKNVELSIQHLNDCNHYAQGCSGGFSIEVLRYMNEFYAVPEKCKPFTASQGICEGHCNKKDLTEIYASEKPYYIGDYFGRTTEEKLMQELYTRGPVVVSFEPTLAFTFYKSGIFTPVDGTIGQVFNKEQQWMKVDHSVLLYGWGEEAGIKYWMVQNSWGEGWGEEGNFRIQRGINLLGIESMGEAAVPKIIPV